MWYCIVGGIVLVIIVEVFLAERTLRKKKRDEQLRARFKPKREYPQDTYGWGKERK